MNRRTTWKRLCSGFLSMVLLLTLLPTSALADGYTDHTDARIIALHKKMNSDNTGPTNDPLNPGSTGNRKLSPSNSLSTDAFDRTDNIINVWVTSSDMSDEEKSDYSTIPYVYDGNTYQSGTKWYLYQIEWANAAITGQETAKGDVMTTAEICAADSYNDYNFDLTEITADPQQATSYTRYIIRYCWTTTPPNRWDSTDPVETYSVEYDFNLPDTGMTLYTIVWDEESQQNALNIRDQGELGNITAAVSNMNAANTTVTDGMTFGIASGLSNYEGFFLFKDNGEEPTDYYYFNGWTVGTDTETTYGNGQSVEVSSQMADGNDTINITANWVEIDPLTAEELVAADDALTLDVFERGGYYKGESVAITNVVANDLLLQWTDTNENLESGAKSGMDLMLDEDSTISYLLTTRLNSNLTSLRDNANYGNFARFTFTLNIDNQLKFANVDADGNASIVFSSAFLKPVDTDPTNIQSATVTPEGNDSYKITFNPANVPTSTDGKSMQIEIQVEWCLDKYSYADAETTKPIQISGLDFKLKEPVADKENFTLNSSANITGSMDMKKRSNIRFYYTAAYGLLNGSSEWQAHFKGNGADPVALVHALQFVDHKLADYDLSQDEDRKDPTNALTQGSREANASYTAYTITATAGENGSITPGTTQVYKGDSQTFTITADSGYHIEDVLVDGASVGAVSSYTFDDVAADHTISVTFEKNSGGSVTPTPTRYTITAEAGEGGSISPSGRVSVTRGSDKTFTISADDGYGIADVLVDGKSVGAVSSYTFENVRANHTIEVVFERTGSAVADPDDTGVSDWLNTEDHNAYLNGYPGSLFGPDNNMTRAEVAQMFYNLLLDKNVPITVTFDDVPADAWYTEAVNTLASLDILNGVGNNKFEPERSITRAEFTTIAMRFTDGALDGENIFPDVNPDDWFYDYVVGSIQYGWINGYPDGTFGPNDPISRAEVTTITNRMLGRSADEAFVDSNQASLVQFGDITDRHWAYYQVMEATNGHDYTKTDGVEDWSRLN